MSLRTPILFCADESVTPWQRAFDSLGAGVDLIAWPDWKIAPSAPYALVWRPPAGALKRFRSLKALFSLGAGIDHLKSDPYLPADIPVVRMADDALVSGMVEYVLYCVLAVQRDVCRYAAQQQRRVWKPLPRRLARDCRVGICGLGRLGRACAEALVRNGYTVQAWSRTRKRLDFVETYAGHAELTEFLRSTDVLINLLPLTDETHGFLDKGLIERLAPGASIVNVGRGAHLVEDDLIAALASGRIRSAFLDVFEEEPLPVDHPFWECPTVVMTPHVASVADYQSSAEYVVAQIACLEEGRALTNVVDWSLGY